MQVAQRAQVGQHFTSTNVSLQRDLRERVDAWFTEQHLSKHADLGMVLKSVFFLGGAVGLWALLVTGLIPGVVAAPACLLLGAFYAGIGFNVGHDAIHGAYSSNATVNSVLGHSFDVLGASSAMWARAHNIVHHTYTNIPGMDHDLEPGPFMLLYQRNAPSRFYRYQHIFAFAMYCFTTLVWVFKKDFAQALAADVRTGRRATNQQLASLLGWKLVHFTLFLGVPLALGHWAWWQVLLGYLLMHAMAGLTLATVFQLAHVVEETSFPLADGPRVSWSEHQLLTTCDFAPKSRVVAWLCGGLNRQVEHHLFARICHVHYPALAPIVAAVAREHGVPYLENATLLRALGSHVRVMRRFGRPSDGV